MFYWVIYALLYVIRVFKSCIMYNFLKFSLLSSLFLLCFLGCPYYAHAGDVSVWNAEKLDWWVSLNEQPEDKKLSKKCEIHWVYDDVLDLSFQRTRQGRLYFGIKPLKNTPALKAFQNLGDEPDYRIDIIKGQNTRTLYGKVAKPDFLVVQVNPDMLEYSYLDQADRLIVRMSEKSYNLPLNNSEENFEVFRTCEKNLNTPENLQRLAQEAAAKVRPTLADPVPVAAQVKTDSMPPPLVPLPKEGEETPSAQTDLTIPPSMEQPSAEAFFIAKDVVYNDRETSLIQSLTKKLAMIEQEKEMLRKQKMTYEAEGLIAQIQSCESSAGDEALDDRVYVKYEAAIESLRAENEVLKETISNVREAEAAEQEGVGLEVSSLERQVMQLKDRNKTLQRSVYEYQIQLEEALTEAQREPDDTDAMGGEAADNTREIDLPVESQDSVSP